MKLFLKQIYENGPVALCDETGTPLPNQMSLVINSQLDDIVTASVIFAVGGDVELSGPETKTDG